jgi:hypothetical protein
VKAATSLGQRTILTVSNNVTGAMIGRMVSVRGGKNVFVLYKSGGFGGCPQSVKVISSHGGFTIQEVNMIALR